MRPDQPQAVDVIASGIHDAKNSMFDALARIGVAVQAIHEGKAGVALRPLAETERAVVAAAERLSKLLSAYRLARPENSLAMLAVDVRGLIEDTAIRVRDSASGGNPVTLDCRYDGFWICDRELVADCLVNALQNGLRHARRQVHLEAAEVDGYLVLAVTDDGPGFPDHLEAHTDARRSGVGLFIARRIAQLHERLGRHGELRLTNSGPLGGARFELRLP